MTKKNFLLLFILLNTKIFAQMSAFEINATIKNVDSGFVQMWYPKTDTTFKLIDSKVSIINGKFTFKGYLDCPQLTLFVIHTPEVVQTEWFFIDIGQQSMTIKIDSIVHLASTSKTFHEFIDKYKPSVANIDFKQKEWQLNYRNLLNTYNGNIPSIKDDSMQILKRKLQSEKDLGLLNYIKHNTFSYVGLTELSFFIKDNGYSAIYKQAFSLIDNTLKKSSLGKKTSEKLMSVQSIAIGSFFPSIPIVDTVGNKIQLDKTFFKEYTLCDFWYSSCGPCISQFPRLNDIYSKWRNKGFEIIGISTDLKKSEMSWKTAIKKHNLLWQQYWDVDYAEATKLSIVLFPTNFLLDKTGKIIAKNIEPAQLEKFLELNIK